MSPIWYTCKGCKQSLPEWFFEIKNSQYLSDYCDDCRKAGKEIDGSIKPLVCMIDQETGNYIIEGNTSFKNLTERNLTSEERAYGFFKLDLGIFTPHRFVIVKSTTHKDEETLNEYNPRYCEKDKYIAYGIYIAKKEEIDKYFNKYKMADEMMK